jgi:hypothetical protein
MEQVKVSAVQKFRVAVVNRKDLKNAPYNPRQIDDNARSKLRKNLKKVGLLQPIIWNKVTGHVVSGHQRLAIIDAIEKRDNYDMQVAVVELDPKTEKEQVVFMNNELAMGSFDLPKLDHLLKEVDFEFAGFDKLDLQVMLPGWAQEQTPAAKSQAEEVDALVEDLENLEEMKKKKKAVREESNQNNPENLDVEFFVVMVFKNRESSEQFLDKIHVDRNEKYISGEMISEMITCPKA